VRLALVAAALLIVALLALGFRLSRWWRAHLLGGRRRRGARAESRAFALLERHGYRIVRAQETAVGFVVVDGDELTFDLRADAIVEKDGERLVAEVKSGGDADVTARSTRRQLLEYAYTYGLDGVLLVDMEAERIVRVEFPRL